MKKTIRFPLAQEHYVAFEVPNPDSYFVHDPGFIVMPDGAYLAFSPCWKRGPVTLEGRRRRVQDFLSITRSEDKGVTWKEISRMSLAEATPILHEGVLYMFTQPQQHQSVYITCSRDGGYSWAEPVKVLDNPLWNCQQSMARRGNLLYWVMDNRFEKLAAVCCNLDIGLMRKDAWRVSEYMQMPPIPKELIRQDYDSSDVRTSWNKLGLLESNVIDIGGKLNVLSRMVLCDYAMANLCIVSQIEDDGKELALSFSHFYPIPGGQCKFNIIKDDCSGLYWMASNLQTNSFDLLGYKPQLLKTDFHSGPGNERRFLTLWYSLDAFNWMPVGIVAYSKVITQSFMYPSMDIDGDDLLILSRSSIHAHNQHDADQSTLHRVKNFRSLAFDLRPVFV